MSAIAADRAEIGRFVHALFCHADADGYVSLRTFEHQRGAKPVEIQAVQINGEGLDPVIARAAGCANRAARHPNPCVFAPPVATFRSAKSAAEADLSNGLCLAIECDEHPAEACRRLIGLLGGVTAVVASGGEWVDPATGETEPRLHAYVRLREPTRTPAEHAQLKRANRLAAALVGSDPSAVPLVHPLRWAGSVHRKGTPKLCRISDMHEDFEIDLADAEERLEAAARMALEHATGPDADRLRVALDVHEARTSTPPDFDPDASDPDLDALADAIPNADEPRAEWIKVGLAFYAASEGKAAGFNAWNRWSRKSGKSHGGTGAQWERFAKSPPNRTDKGALVARARRTDPDFRLPSWGPAHKRPQPNGHDQGHWEDPVPPPEIEWAEPLDIIGTPELVGWPTLTAACLPASVYRYVEAEAARMNVDPCPLAGHVLAACSISISDLFTVKPKLHDHYTQQARVWVCVVKNVGARGTEMLHSAIWPLKERNAALHKAWQAEHARWEARQDTKKDKTDPPPKNQRIMTTDATTDAMSEILKHGSGTSKLGAIYDELVTFLSGFGRYSDKGGGAERGVLLEAYDGGPHWIDRIKRGQIYVPNWSLVVAGNIQPRRLAQLAPHLIDDGLFQRFLTLHTRPAATGIDDDQPSDPTSGKEYRELHTTLAQLAPVKDTTDRALPCYFDDEARAERQKFMRLVERLQVDPSLPTIIRETAPKWSGLLARIALVFHVIELAEQRNGGSEPSLEDICRVTGPTVTMAATFLRRIALPNLYRLGFETMPEEGAAAGHGRWIAQHILAHSATTITSSEIGRVYRDLRGKVTEIAAAMDVLTDTGWVQPADARKDGRRWVINPAVHVDFAVAAADEKARRAAVVELIKVKVQTL